MTPKRKPKVLVYWRPVPGEPSPLWRRLYAKLFADKRISPTSPHEADSSECGGDENKQNPPNERFTRKESHGQSETHG